MANILYFHDGTQEIICDEFDFAKMLYEKLGIDSEQCFLGYIENMKYEINELEEELKQIKNSGSIENDDIKNYQNIIDGLKKEIAELEDEVIELEKEIQYMNEMQMLEDERRYMLEDLDYDFNE